MAEASKWNVLLNSHDFNFPTVLRSIKYNSRPLEGNVSLLHILALLRRSGSEHHMDFTATRLGLAANGVLSAGASVDAATDAGETPLHFAARANNVDMVEFLLAEGADVHRAAADGSTPQDAALRAQNGAAEALLRQAAQSNSEGSSSYPSTCVVAMVETYINTQSLFRKSPDVWQSTIRKIVSRLGRIRQCTGPSEMPYRCGWVWEVEFPRNCYPKLSTATIYVGGGGKAPGIDQESGAIADASDANDSIPNNAIRFVFPPPSSSESVILSFEMIPLPASAESTRDAVLKAIRYFGTYREYRHTPDCQKWEVEYSSIRPHLRAAVERVRATPALKKHTGMVIRLKSFDRVYPIFYIPAFTIETVQGSGRKASPPSEVHCQRGC